MLYSRFSLVIYIIHDINSICVKRINLSFLRGTWLALCDCGCLTHQDESRPEYPLSSIPWRQVDLAIFHGKTHSLQNEFILAVSSGASKELECMQYCQQEAHPPPLGIRIPSGGKQAASTWVKQLSFNIEVSEAQANFSSPSGGVMVSEILCGFNVVWGEDFMKLKLQTKILSRKWSG